jgi:hypothetical protein
VTGNGSSAGGIKGAEGREFLKAPPIWRAASIMTARALPGLAGNVYIPGMVFRA